MDTKAELVAAVAAASGTDQRLTEKVLVAFRDVLEKEMVKGSGEVRFLNAGTFKRVKRIATNRKNPFTGEMLAVPERLAVKFEPSPSLKKVMRSGA